MDAFYASVEQRDHPEWQGKPLAVGGSRERGVVAAASYEARKFGVRSAMPSALALKKCPNLIFATPRFDVYKEISGEIRQIFREYTGLIEPLSLDEAYLDVTENKKSMPYAMDIAEEIRQKIKDQLNLTASAGISYNKFLAKIASDVNKPNGYFVITPKKAEKFIENLAIEKFYGVGKVSAKRMHELGIYTGKDLKGFSKKYLIRHFGKLGSYYYQVARGIDKRPVNPSRIRKSIGVERTFESDLTNKDDMIEKIGELIEKLSKSLEKHNTRGKTLTLKVKYKNFQQVTRSNTQSSYYDIEKIRSGSVTLLKDVPRLEEGVRLLGLQISNFDLNENTQNTLEGQMEFNFRNAEH